MTLEEARRLYNACATLMVLAASSDDIDTIDARGELYWALKALRRDMAAIELDAPNIVITPEDRR